MEDRITSCLGALELGVRGGTSSRKEAVEALEAAVREGGARASGVAVRLGALPALTALLRTRDEELLCAVERCVAMISSGGSAASTTERKFRVGDTCVIIHELNDATTLGWHVWAAALRLAKHIKDVYGKDSVATGVPSRMMNGRRVLELGAGCALCGILAAHYGGNVTLTDIEEPLLENMRLSVAANEMRGRAGIARLDWSCAVDADEDEHGDCKACIGDESGVHGHYDIILGADIVYEPPHPLWVALTIKRYLASDGVALVLNAVRDESLMESFLTNLVRTGLECTVTNCETECALSDFGIDWVRGSETTLQCADYYVGGFKLIHIKHGATHFSDPS